MSFVSLWLIPLAACGARDDLGPAVSTTPPAALATRFYPPEGWTWGLLQVGDTPPVRYGVGAPRRSHRGEIVIVPGFGEPAEAWFETVNDLIANEWGVWVLDLHGQGGSARAGEPREMVSVDSFEPDAGALQAVLREATRAARGQPVIVLAAGGGAAVALSSLSMAGRGVAGAVLSAPVLVDPNVEHGEVGRWMRRLGFGDGLAEGQEAWSSAPDTPPAFGDPVRGRVSDAWMRANPELRTGGASWSWMAAWADLSEQVREPSRLRRVTSPVLVITSAADPVLPSAPASAACRALPHCTLLQLDGARTSPHLETDTVRQRWMEAIRAFAEAHRPAA